jgi:hypothetical protein
MSQLGERGGSWVNQKQVNQKGSEWASPRFFGQLVRDQFISDSIEVGP